MPVPVGALLRRARDALRATGTDDPASEARLLVENLTGITRVEAITEPDRPVDAGSVARILEAIDRRISGEPVYRILGWRDFAGLRLVLSADTLEPRPDTETLVELASEHLEAWRETGEGGGEVRLLDLGTGTGAVALALLARHPAARAVGVDIADGALETSRRNADLNGLGTRYATLQSDWFGNVTGKFHAIVSNPPYINSGDIAGLEVEVRDHDPLAALDGGPDGLDAYRRIALDAAAHLLPGGSVLVEIGSTQAETVTRLFEDAGWRRTDLRHDLSGHARALGFRVSQ